jgi:3-oxoacyl-[acyl-carrier-protein] synthase-1
MKAHAEELNERISEKLQPSFGPQGRLAFQFMAQGHAGAVVGLDRAVSLITSGQSGLCLVGGVESYLEADALAWLDGERRVMRGDIRGGFPPGEGAALFAVASDALRRQLGLPSLATVEAVACANETADEKSAEGLQGVALTEVFRRVGSALKSAGQRFDDVYVDINDERARTTDYAFALLRCGARFRDGSQYETMVGKTGELGAASAAFNCVLAATALASGYSRGQHALVSSASWNGLRGAVLLRKGRG